MKIKILALIEEIKEIKANIINTQKENENKLLEIYYKLDNIQRNLK